MNTGQFNSAQFNDSGLLRLVVEFALTITHSVVRFPKKVRAFGVSVVSVLALLKTQILEFVLTTSYNIVNKTKTIRAFTANIVFSKALSMFTIKNFSLSISDTVQFVRSELLELSVNIASAIQRNVGIIRGYVLNIGLEKFIFLSQVKDFGITISSEIIILPIRILDLSINAVITTKRLIGKVVNYDILLSINKIAFIITYFTYTVSIVTNILFNKIMELGINIAFGITKITQVVKSIAINVSYTKTSFTQRLYNFIINISIATKILRILTLNFAVSIAIAFVTNARYIYLYWRRQLNPDIIGFKVLESDSPYGVYTQIATTTDLHYVKTFFGGAKWIKVIPYTSRGDLKYILFKGVKYG